MKILWIMLVFLVGLAPELNAQLTERRVERLETRVSRLEQAGRDYGAFGFVAGVLAALWAQNTRRNAWLWFFLGLLFGPISLLVLLYKNSRDRRRTA